MLVSEKQVLTMSFKGLLEEILDLLDSTSKSNLVRRFFFFFFAFKTSLFNLNNMTRIFKWGTYQSIHSCEIYLKTQLMIDCLFDLGLIFYEGSSRSLFICASNISLTYFSINNMNEFYYFCLAFFQKAQILQSLNCSE